jgi:FMN phosphatase YigB (HAD superfamily)
MPGRGAARRAGRRAGRRAARRTVRRRAVVRPVMVPRRRRRSVLGSLLALGGTAAVAYKIGQNSVKQVEQHTGKSFDHMSEEELASAIDELDIDLPADEADQAAGEAYEESEDEPDYIDELERLAGLKEKGIISEEEFQAKKKQLLGL